MKDTEKEEVVLYVIGTSTKVVEERLRYVKKVAETKGWKVMGVYSDVSKRRNSKLLGLAELDKDISSASQVRLMVNGLPLLFRSSKFKYNWLSEKVTELVLSDGQILSELLVFQMYAFSNLLYGLREHRISQRVDKLSKSKTISQNTREDDSDGYV